MKLHPLPTLLAALCTIGATFIAGCGNDRLRNVHSVTVDSNVVRPKRIGYTNQASANVDIFNIVAGGALLPSLVLAGVHQGVISKPRKEIEAVLESRSIAIEKIVPAAFADEMALSGLFTVVPQGGADATFKLKIIGYALAHQGNAWTSSALAPTVFVEAQMAGGDGRNFYGVKKLGMSAKSDWHTHEQYRDQPELLRTGLEEASKAATRAIITEIRKKMPKQAAAVSNPTITVAATQGEKPSTNAQTKSRTSRTSKP